MKKHDEGYILAYVFVILVVICIIATSALTIPLTNLKAQKAAVEKMQQQYQAQGMLEETLAKLRNTLPDINMNNTSVDITQVKGFVESCPEKGLGILYASSETRMWEMEEIPGEGLYVTSPITWYEKDVKDSKHYDCSFSLTAVSGSEMITVGIKLQDVIDGSTIQTPEINTFSYSICTFTAPAADGQEGGGVNAP